MVKESPKKLVIVPVLGQGSPPSREALYLLLTFIAIVCIDLTLKRELDYT